MTDREPVCDGFRSKPVRIAVQLLGFVAASHLLNGIARSLPGFAQSRLAEAGEGAQPGAFLDLADPFLLTLFATALISALVEELIFRGAIQSTLRTRIGPIGAILIAAGLFGLVHFDLHQSVVAALLGIQLGLLRELFGLGLAVAAHLMNNLLWVSVVALHATSGGDTPTEPWLGGVLRYSLAVLSVGIAYASLWKDWRNPYASSASPA